MKKIIVLVFLFLILFVCVAQAPIMNSVSGKYYPLPESVSLNNITLNSSANGWAQMGQACAGCPSFWYQILRTQIPYQAEDGGYYFFFYFYFYSNSFYPNGMIGSTYITDVNFMVDGNTVFYSPYLLIEANNQKFGAWIRTRNPNSMVSFNVSQISVF